MTTNPLTINNIKYCWLQGVTIDQYARWKRVLERSMIACFVVGVIGLIYLEFILNHRG